MGCDATRSISAAKDVRYWPISLKKSAVERRGLATVPVVAATPLQGRPVTHLTDATYAGATHATR